MERTGRREMWLKGGKVKNRDGETERRGEEGRLKRRMLQGKGEGEDRTKEDVAERRKADE